MIEHRSPIFMSWGMTNRLVVCGRILLFLAYDEKISYFKVVPDLGFDFLFLFWFV